MWALVTFCRASWRPRKEMGQLSGAMRHNSDIAGVCSSSARAWFRGNSRPPRFRHPDKSMKLMYESQATCCLRTLNSLSFGHLHRKDGGPGKPCGVLQNLSIRMSSLWPVCLWRPAFLPRRKESLSRGVGRGLKWTNVCWQLFLVLQGKWTALCGWLIPSKDVCTLTPRTYECDTLYWQKGLWKCKSRVQVASKN